MALPEGITPKTVTVGIPTKFNGTPATGSATLTAPKNLVHIPTGTPLFSGSVTKQFSGLTEVTFTDLVPTDADGLNRVDWTYTLTVRVNGAIEQPDPTVFILPAAGPDTVDAELLVEVPSSAGTPISALVLTADTLDAYTAANLADATSDTRTALDALDLGNVTQEDLDAVVAAQATFVVGVGPYVGAAPDRPDVEGAFALWNGDTDPGSKAVDGDLGVGW